LKNKKLSSCTCKKRTRTTCTQTVRSVSKKISILRGILFLGVPSLGSKYNESMAANLRVYRFCLFL
jgi:hypothetical protein